MRVKAPLNLYESSKNGDGVHLKHFYISVLKLFGSSLVAVL